MPRPEHDRTLSEVIDRAMFHRPPDRPVPQPVHPSARRIAAAVRDALCPNPPTGTCDWGHCDADAIVWRWDRRYGWLPACPAHAEEGDPDAF